MHLKVQGLQLASSSETGRETEARSVWEQVGVPQMCVPNGDPIDLPGCPGVAIRFRSDPRGQRFLLVCGNDQFYIVGTLGDKYAFERENASVANPTVLFGKVDWTVMSSNIFGRGSNPNLPLEADYSEWFQGASVWGVRQVVPQIRSPQLGQTGALIVAQYDRVYSQI